MKVQKVGSCDQCGFCLKRNASIKGTFLFMCRGITPHKFLGGGKEQTTKIEMPNWCPLEEEKQDIFIIGTV